MILIVFAGWGFAPRRGQADILGAYTFLTLRDLEQNPVTLVQRPQPILHKTGIVDEDIRSPLAVNKTIAFFLIEPLNRAFQFDFSYKSKRNPAPKTQIACTYRISVIVEMP